MAFTQIKVYQLDKVIEDNPGVISDATTVAELREFLLTDKDKHCPKCADTGRIDTDNDNVKDSPCDICGGDTMTTAQYIIDYENPTLAYKLA